MAKCKGECKWQVTNILRKSTPGWKVTGSTDPAATPQGGDLKKAAAALTPKIDNWGKPVLLDPKCNAACECEDVEEGDVDWKKKKQHTRTFQDYFTSAGDKFIVFIEVDFKEAIVPKACIEQKDDPIFPD